MYKTVSKCTKMYNQTFLCFIHNQDTNETFPEKSVAQKAMHCSLLLVKVFNAQRDHNFRICQKSLSGKKRRSGAHSKKTLFIGRSFIKSIDRSVEKSNNSIIDHLVCQAKLLLQYYQDFYSIWKSRSRWTTQRSAIGEELLFVLKCCPTPPTSSRKMAKLLCSHIEPYILEQVMIYFTFC